MRYLLALCLFLGFALPAVATPATVILIRHAQKVETEDPNPDLTPTGQKQAKALVVAIRDRWPDLKVAYVSQAKRTQQTAEPLKKELGVKVNIRASETEEGKRALATEILGQADKTVLVIGHTNTLPDLIARLGGPAGTEIEGYTQLYVLTINQSGPATLKLPGSWMGKASNKKKPK